MRGFPKNLQLCVLLGCLDLTFHGQWHTSRIRRQQLCSGSFVCLGSNRSLANRVDAAVEVVLARSQNCPPKLRPDLYNKGYAISTTLGGSYQPPWCKPVLNKDCAVQNGIFFEFGDSHYAEVVFVLGATVILANRVDAAFEVVLARSQTYPPKLRPTTKADMRRLQLWDSYQRPWSKTA